MVGAGLGAIMDSLPTRTATDSRNEDFVGDGDEGAGAGGSAAVGAGLDGGTDDRWLEDVGCDERLAAVPKDGETLDAVLKTDTVDVRFEEYEAKPGALLLSESFEDTLVTPVSAAYGCGCRREFEGAGGGGPLGGIDLAGRTDCLDHLLELRLVLTLDIS